MEIWDHIQTGAGDRFVSSDETPCTVCQVRCGWLKGQEAFDRWLLTGWCQACQDAAEALGHPVPDSPRAQS